MKTIRIHQQQGASKGRREVARNKQHLDLDLSSLSVRTHFPYRQAFGSPQQQMAAVSKETYVSAMQVLMSICLVIRSDPPEWVIPAYLHTRVTKYASGALEYFEDYPATLDALTNLLAVFKKNTPMPDLELNALAVALRKDSARMRLEKPLSDAQLDLYSATRQFLFKWGHDEGAYKKMVRLVSVVGDLGLSSNFEADYADSDLNPLNSVDPTKVKKELEKIVYKHTKIRSIDFPKGMKVALKETAPEDMARHTLLRKQLSDSFQTRLRTYIRDTLGGQLAEVEQVRQLMIQEGIPCAVPKGFVGKLDDQGRYYTTDGDLLKNTPRGDVKMNVGYEAGVKGKNYYCTYQNPGEPTINKCYTVKHTEGATDVKYEKADQLIGQFDSMQARWRADLMKSDLEVAVKGAIVEIIYLTGARIGSKVTNINDGICTWTVKVLKKVGEAYKISYTGKSYGLQTHYIRPDTKWAKKVITILDRLTAGKGKTELLFHISPEGKRARHVNSNEINAYLKSMSGGVVTAKLFRTALGSKLAWELIESSEVLKAGNGMLTKKAADAEWLRITKEVGKLLGHYRVVKKEAIPDSTTAVKPKPKKGAQDVTGATAVGSYINPTVIAEFWDRAGLRASSAINKIIRRGD